MRDSLIGRPAPALQVESWLQGDATTLADLYGQVVLLEVFQVNCPGCFLYSLPQAIDLYKRYRHRGLSVLALATAFEDFELNTLQNLRLLLESGTVVGATLAALAQQGELDSGCWHHRLPFPVAMDQLAKNHNTQVEDADVLAFIRNNLPAFSEQPAAVPPEIRKQVVSYLQSLTFRAATFERYRLQGTPSHLVIDKRGILRASRFGYYPELEADIEHHLREPG